MTEFERLVIASLARIEAAVCKPDIDPSDLATLKRLLPAIAGAIGSDIFLSSDLLEHDAPGIQIVCAGMSVSRIGQLLKSAEGHVVDGYVVGRGGKPVAGAVVWKLSKVSADLCDLASSLSSARPPRIRDTEHRGN